jgi:hypothetical protein
MVAGSLNPADMMPNTSMPEAMAGMQDAASKHDGLDDKALEELLEDTLGEFSDEIAAHPGVS